MNFFVTVVTYIMYLECGCPVISRACHISKVVWSLQVRDGVKLTRMRVRIIIVGFAFWHVAHTSIRALRHRISVVILNHDVAQQSPVPQKHKLSHFYSI